MAKTLLITDNKQALAQDDLFLPREVWSRDELKLITPTDFSDVILDGTDTEILDRFTRAKKWFLPNGLDFSENVDIISESLQGKQSYETPLPKIEDNYTDGGLPSFPNSVLPPDQFLDDYIENEIPLEDQINILQPLLDGKKIGAGSVAELTSQLVNLCRANELFVRDTITGLFRSRFARKPLISADQANTIFSTHFCDKLAIKTTDYKVDKETGGTVQSIKYRPIKPDELKLLWKNIALYSTFNSRKDFFDSIPEWDGEVRIMSFMKKYFNCDTNPNFFLLLMTCLVAKFSPRNDYCPYFFDIVARSKGIGKSLLCRRLLGGKYCGFLNFAVGRRDDFFVNAYDGNNAIVVDDECTWVSNTRSVGKITTDEMKTLVSSPVDKFSRKFGQPEEHERSFIIMRTSNDVNQVYATNERRQIVFECHLKEQECRILDLPDSFFVQMLAEAKDYYIKHNGVYQLTESDKLEVKDSNLDNYNWETKENYAILDFVAAIRSEPDKWGVVPTARKFQEYKWGTYKKYVDWCEEHRKTCLPSRAFWRAVEALAELPENHITVIAPTKYEINSGGKCRIFRIDPPELTAEEQAILDMDDIPV